MSFREPLSLQHVKDVLQEIRRSLKHHVREAYLFGSIVFGSAVPRESDIDLLIVPTDASIDYYRLLSRALELALEKGLKLHIVIYDERRHGKSFLDSVREKGFRLI